MEILRGNKDLNILLDLSNKVNVDLGWEENFKEFEDDTLEKIINPIENYETVRFIHKEYDFQLVPNEKQYGIWYYFNFLTGLTYSQEYEVVGITPRENAKMLKQSTESFFRLEFYKTPNNESPDRINRRLVMTRNLALPSGESRFHSILNDNIFLPIFSGSNFRNKDIMYLFWFMDETAFNETTITGTTFWMTAKFFNATDGSILDFINHDPTAIEYPTNVRFGLPANPIVFYEKGNDPVNESTELYYRVIIDRENYTYQVFRN